MFVKRVGLLAVLLCVMVAGGVFAAAGGIRVYVQGQPIAAQAIVQHGTVYLPARAVSQALGIPVEWDSSARAVYVDGRPSSVPERPTPAPPRTRKKAPPKTQPIQDIVHVTRTGEKYHAAGCRYLSKSDIPMSRKDAIASGYTACSVCGGG